MEADQLQLSDLVSFYPERNDENIQAIISAKKEFSELASLKNESVGGIQTELYNHQKFFGRFMRFYDKGLVIDKPGTGKTCKVVTPMEWFQRNRGIIRNFYVIVPNKAVKHDVKQQIICGCDTKDKYKLPGLFNAATPAGQRSSASKGLAKYYKIFTHGEFARFLIKKYPDELQVWENLIITYERLGPKGEETKEYSGIAKQVKEDFPEWKVRGPKKSALKGRGLDNFILKKVTENPERYKLRMTDEEIRIKAEENHNKMVEEMSGSFFYLDEVHLLTISEKNTAKDPLKERLKQRYYNQYYRLFHAVKRSKIVLMSATPMINEPDDIRPIINLIRDEDDLLPEDFNYLNASIEEVNHYFGGYITYVAPVDNKVDVIYEGDDIEYSTPTEKGGTYQGVVRAVPLQMEEFQDYYYTQLLQSEQLEAFKNRSLQASVFVFPDGSIGTAGLKKYAKRNVPVQHVGETKEDFNKRKKKIVSWYVANNVDGFANSISTIEGIRSMSVKFADIIQYANDDRQGVVYVNIPYVEGGAIPLALCLEAMGYEIFRERESVFETEVYERDEKGVTRKRRKLRPYCPPSESSGVIRKLKRSFPPKRRCAIYSSEAVFSSTVNEAALEIVSSAENVDGRYVKVIIITPVGKVGISVNNVSKVFTVTSDWNESNNIQKEYRGIRATSHRAAIQEKQAEAQREAERNNEPIYQEDLDDIRVDLSVYRLAAISKYADSSDLDVYLTAKEKEIRIQKFFRQLMIVAVDCALNKDRNQQLHREDGSAECNYQSCQYVCYGEGNYTTDYSTYDIYYLGEVLDSIIDKIIPVLREYGSITYEQLYKQSLLVNIPPKHIVIAIAELIRNKRAIKDRFGYTVYVGESNGNIFLNREYPQLDFSNYSISYYGKNLINTDPSTIDDSIISLEANITDVTESLRQYPVGGDIFNAELSLLSISSRANILEQSIHNWVHGTNDNFDNYIMQMYGDKWFNVYEPMNLINEELDKEAAKSNRGRPRTRKIKKFKVNRLTGIRELVEDEDEEEVYFHILYTEREAPTRHGMIARELKGEGRYRLYKPSEMIGWREMNKYELVAYNTFVQNTRQQREVNVQQNIAASGNEMIYGRISGNTLWIVDKTKEPANANGKSMYKGKVCTTWSKHELVPVLFELGIPPPEEMNQYMDYYFALNVVQNSLGKMKLKYFDQYGNKMDYDPNEIAQWDPFKVEMYAKWLIIADERSHRHTKGKLCGLITAKMIEQGRVMYI